jgi:hypothetical protein
MSRQPVSAGIYSTATGQLIVYEQAELAEAWQRLRAIL